MRIAHALLISFEVVYDEKYSESQMIRQMIRRHDHLSVALESLLRFFESC